MFLSFPDKGMDIKEVASKSSHRSNNKDDPHNVLIIIGLVTVVRLCNLAHSLRSTHFKFSHKLAQDGTA